MLEHFATIQSAIDYINSFNALHVYLLVLVLMMVESSFIPFPSEVVVPPAVMVAMAPTSSLSIPAIVLVATAGAMIGAFINYYMGWFLGRPIIHKLADTRLAHALLIDKAKVEKAELYFVNHGKSSTFVGRLVPGIRQLISIPAGIAKMNVATFTLYTALGALTWNIVLAVIGYVFGRNIALLESVFHELTIALLVLGVLFVLYLVYNGVKKKKG
ncbi:MAG: DedA family protein [Prevotellaceae bacterium]|jgi:membrane protein DedA with SNARE-associated domain|nr:DedA family protein [Prevotellaceae bacterium]